MLRALFIQAVSRTFARFLEWNQTVRVAGVIFSAIERSIFDEVLRRNLRGFLGVVVVCKRPLSHELNELCLRDNLPCN